MAIEFSVQVDGVPVLIRSFNRVQRHINDLKRVWDQVEPEFFAMERQQFRTEGAAGASGRWAPLSPAYTARKLKKYGAQPIMVASGRLRKSLFNEGGSDSVSIKGNREAFFGTRVEYAAYHQRGAGNLPERKPIDPSTEQKRTLTKSIQRGLVNIIRSDPEVTRGLEVTDVR